MEEIHNKKLSKYVAITEILTFFLFGNCYPIIISSKAVSHTLKTVYLNVQFIVGSTSENSCEKPGTFDFYIS